MSVFNSIPLWLILVLTAALILLSMECGFRLGAFHKKQREDEQKTDGGIPVSTMVQIQLGLVAFLIAFTFEFAAQRYNERRALVIEEANAIGTTFLRADFLPAANANEVKEILRKYVDERLRFVKEAKEVRDPEFISDALKRFGDLQKNLWKQALVVSKSRETPIISLFVSSVNETIDLHSERVAAIKYGQIPDIIWVVLYTITSLGMVGCGYQFGNSGTRCLTAVALVVISFSLVLIMIVDLDRPMEGFLGSYTQPLSDLQKNIGLPSSQYH